jgi:hypothetical protein
MCIIVDANTAHEFGRALTEEALAIFEWLMRDGGTIAAGGRVKRELVKTRFRNIYHTLLLAGRLYQYDDDEVDRVEANVMAQLDLRSDDPHVIALARVSLCRLLFSRDQDLHADFCNPTILRPRGRVYQDKSHHHLLRSARACRKP